MVHFNLHACVYVSMKDFVVKFSWASIIYQLKNLIDFRETGCVQYGERNRICNHFSIATHTERSVYIFTKSFDLYAISKYCSFLNQKLKHGNRQSLHELHMTLHAR